MPDKSDIAFASQIDMPVPPTRENHLVRLKELGAAYSLDEIKTHDTWIDGKPIYRKTYRGVSPANNNVSDFTIVSSGVDTPVNYMFTTEYGNNELMFSASDIFNTYMAGVPLSERVLTNLKRTSAGALMLEVWVSAVPDAKWGNQKFVVTVWYTKTTD
jgi:hypothetical protein